MSAFGAAGGFGAVDILRLTVCFCFAGALPLGDLGADGEAAVAVGVGALVGAGVDTETAAAGEGAVLEGVAAFGAFLFEGGACRLIEGALFD